MQSLQSPVLFNEDLELNSVMTCLFGTLLVTLWEGFVTPTHLYCVLVRDGALGCNPKIFPTTEYL